MSVIQDPLRPSSPASTSISTNIHNVVIPTTSTPLEWYRPTESSYSTIDEAREAGLWSYPSTAEERARCAVFRHLWEKGYYMGCGIKFGGEFLVYPGSFVPCFSESLILNAPFFTNEWLTFWDRRSSEISLSLYGFSIDVILDTNSAYGIRCARAARDRDKESTPLVYMGRSHEESWRLFTWMVWIWMSLLYWYK